MIYNVQIDKHNGSGFTALENIFTGFSLTQPLNEELDSGSLIFISTSNAITPIMSVIKITVDGVNSFYYVSRDNVTIEGKENQTYLHTLSLIELTKKLEKYTNYTLCFTQPTGKNEKYYYLRDCIERIIRTCPLGMDVMTSLWEYPTDLTRSDSNIYSGLPIPILPTARPLAAISNELSNALEGIVAPQFVFQNLTLRELIDGVLTYVNAICKVETNNNLYNMLGATFYNTLLNIIDTFTLDYEEKDLSIEEYSTQIESNTQNQINESGTEKSSIVYPTASTFAMIMSSEYEYSINDSNRKIITQYPIYKVDDVEFEIPTIKVSYFQNAVYPDGTHKQNAVSFTDLSISIKDFVKEYQQYKNLKIFLQGMSTISDTIEIQDMLYKNTCLDYTQYGSEIDCSKSFKAILLNYPAINSTILLSTCEYVSKVLFNSTMLPDLFSLWGYTLNIEHVGNIEIHNVDGLEYGSIYSMSPAETYNAPRYRIAYTPSITSNISCQREETKDINLYSNALSHQQERLISFENFSNNIWSLAQRQGTQAREVTVHHSTREDLFHVGDYTSDREVITKAEYIYFNDYILGKYELSKDYNRINEFIGLNSKIRQYQMPSGKESYERLLKINNYVEVADTQTIGTSSYLTDSAVTCYMATLFPSGRDIYDKINGVVYTSLDSEWIAYLDSLTLNAGAHYHNLLLECSTNGGGSTISLDFGFNDNIKCGDAYTPTTINGVEKILKTPIPYCKPTGNNIGFLRSANIKVMGKNYTFQSTYLPLVEDLASQYHYISIPNMLILKDPSEILRFNYSLSTISLNENIVIGRCLTSRNRLITNQHKNELRLVELNKLYGKYDNLKVKSADIINNVALSANATLNVASANYAQIVFNASFINALNANTKTVAIVDTDNNIYLTINKNYFTNKNFIVFNFKSLRTNIKYEY